MIIDADTHISISGDTNTITVEKLIEEMDKANVEKAITWLQPPYMREISESNRYVYDASTRFPTRLIPFGWADPHLGQEKSINEIKKCLLEYGFHGVKLNGAQNSFHIDEKALTYPLFEEIARHKSVLALHCGSDEYDFTHPYRAGKIAKDFPELPILLVHMGGVSRPSLSKSAIEVAKEYDNIMLVGSAIAYIEIMYAIKELGASRVCYGSDAPFSFIRSEVAAYKAMLSCEVSATDEALIMGGNISNLLKLNSDN